jgi:cobalt-zinc-cadmium efflux system protein
MPGDHAHGRERHGSPRRALGLGLAVTLVFVAIEAATGLAAGSLALVSDAGHALADSAGLLLALAAATLARRPADARRTYGYARAEVLAVPVHVTLLLGIAAFIVYESVMRLGDPRSVDTTPVLVVGAAGLAVNLAVVRMLHSHAHESLNARAARLEAAADAVSSVAVLASAAFIALGGWRGTDVVVALGIAAFIVPRAFALLRQAASILLESAPPGLDPRQVMEASSTVEGVIALHDVHVWSIAPHFPALSAHVELADVACTEHVLTDLAALFRQRFGVGHVTLQPETRRLHEAMACCLSPDAALIDPTSHDHPAAEGAATGHTAPLHGS